MRLLEYIVFIHNVNSKTRLPYVIYIWNGNTHQSTPWLHGVTTNMDSQGSLIVYATVVVPFCLLKCSNNILDWCIISIVRKSVNPINVYLFSVCWQSTPTHINVSTLHCSRYRYSLRTGQSGDRILVGGEIFRTRPDRPWSPFNLLYNRFRVWFQGIKRPGRGVDHPPPHLAPERAELYLYSPSVASWSIPGWTSAYLLYTPYCNSSDLRHFNYSIWGQSAWDV